MEALIQTAPYKRYGHFQTMSLYPQFYTSFCTIRFSIETSSLWIPRKNVSSSLFCTLSKSRDGAAISRGFLFSKNETETQKRSQPAKLIEYAFRKHQRQKEYDITHAVTHFRKCQYLLSLGRKPISRVS